MLLIVEFGGERFLLKNETESCNGPNYATYDGVSEKIFICQRLRKENKTENGKVGWQERKK